MGPFARSRPKTTDSTTETTTRTITTGASIKLDWGEIHVDVKSESSNLDLRLCDSECACGEGLWSDYERLLDAGLFEDLFKNKSKLTKLVENPTKEVTEPRRTKPLETVLATPDAHITITVYAITGQTLDDAKETEIGRVATSLVTPNLVSSAVITLNDMATLSYMDKPTSPIDALADILGDKFGGLKVDRHGSLDPEDILGGMPFMGPFGPSQMDGSHEHTPPTPAMPLH